MNSISWNGPICPRCHRGYIGRHVCSADDIQRQIDSLQGHLDALRGAQQSADTCPCNPARGGSGICGCVLSGITITC
jgi:hypothetical protein